MVHRSLKYILQITKTRLKTYGCSAFSFTALRPWNALPMDIKFIPSVSVNYRRILFKSTYNQIPVYFIVLEFSFV